MTLQQKDLDGYFNPRTSLEQPHVGPPGVKRHITTAADMWLQSVRPWCKGIFFAAFFFLSIMQSITFFVTYSQMPMTSVVKLEKLTKDHMPWITICPNPGVSFTNLERYIEENSVVEDPNDLLVKTPRTLSVQGITPRELEGVLAQTNDSVNDFLNAVSWPLWMQMKDCFLKGTGKRLLASCSFSPQSFFRTSTSWLNLSSTTPMVIDTPTGRWETDLVLETLSTHFYFRLCSTFQPNFGLKAGKSDWLEMRFALAMDQHYTVSSLRLKQGFENGLGMPTFTVYLRQPYSKMESYPTLSEEGEFFELKLGQRAEFSLTVEKYTFLNSASYECKAGMAVQMERTDCLRNCFESRFLKSTCRIPGFRNRSVTPEFTEDGEPEVCHTAAHFTAIKHGKLDWARTGQTLYNMECADLCPKPCIKFNYEGKDITNFEVANTGVVSDFRGQAGSAITSDNFKRDAVLKFSVKSPYAKVVEQQYAFGMHQLIGELGGTWGLFLGLSIVSVLDFIEKGLLMVLERVSC